MRAALADVLLNGLGQDRLRRLFGHAAGRSRALADLPADWSLGLQPGAALFEIDQWQRALDEATGRRADAGDPRPVVMPILRLLAEWPRGGCAGRRDAIGHSGPVRSGPRRFDARRPKGSNSH